MTERALQNKTRLEDIRPARGVKVKQKEHPREKNEPPRIIQDVKPVGDFEPPTEEAMRLLAQSSTFKDNLMSSMMEFNGLLKIRTLPENKTEEERKKEQEIVSKLAQAALAVEDLSPKEGLLSMCILAVRQALSLRDAGNEIAHRIVQMENRMKKIEDKIENVNITPEIKKEVVDSKKQMLEMSDMLRKLAQGGTNG